MKAAASSRKKSASTSGSTPTAAVTRRRQRLNLSVRADYVEQARAAKLNLSRVLEESLAVRLKVERERAWLEQNREAIAEYNDYVGRYGMLSDTYRRF